MNIIYSAESLRNLNKKDIVRLQSVFKDYNVKIIYTYRELLTKEISDYNARFKRAMKLPNIVDYINESIVIHGIEAVNNINYYAEVFNTSNVIILDYYGILAANSDIAYVVVCDIMDVYCNKGKDLINGNAGHENPAIDLIPYMITNEIVYVANSQQCLKSADLSTKSKLLTIITTKLHNEQVKYPLPMVDISFESFSVYAKNYDVELHDHLDSLGIQILYSNITANDEARDSVGFVEIDYPGLYNNAHWMEWLRKEAKEAIINNKLVPC